MRQVPSQVGRLEGAARARRAAAEPCPPLLIVYPDEWPAADRAAYDAAGGDAAKRAALVGQHAGARPGPTTTVIELRVRPDGPQ